MVPADRIDECKIVLTVIYIRNIMLIAKNRGKASKTLER